MLIIKNIDMHKHASKWLDITTEKISLLSVYNLNFIIPCIGEYYNILPVFMSNVAEKKLKLDM